MNQTLGFSKLYSTRTGRLMIIIFLIIVLALASFIAGKWMRSTNPPIDQMMFNDDTNSEGNSIVGQGVAIDVTPAAALPKTEYDALGMFVRREDNSIFIGIGINSFGVTLGPNGPVAIYDGPLLEVVITKETKIFRDETEEPTSYSSNTVLQQEIGSGSLDELVDGSQSVFVWGRKVGDRLIADVLLYKPPWVPKRQ